MFLYTHHTQARSYTSPEPHQSPLHPSKDTLSSSFPSLPSSPYHSPTITVKRVEGTLSHTDQTSHPQVIVQVGRKGHNHRSPSSAPRHSRSNSLTDNRTVEQSQPLQPSGRATSTSALHVIESIPNAGSQKVLSNLSRELALTQTTVKENRQVLSSSAQQLQNGTCAHVSDHSQTSDIPSVLNDKQDRERPSEEGESVTLQELIDSELRLNSHRSSLESQNLPHRSPSVASSTPSEVSTIVPRDLVPSRCSGGSFPEDTEQESVTKEADFNPTTDTSDRPHTLSTGHPLSHSVSTQGASEESNHEVSASQTLSQSSPLLEDIEALLSSHLSHSEHGAALGRGELLLPSSSSADSATLSIPQQRTHPTVASLKEDSRRSFYSSSSSVNSTVCSVIEVSYSYPVESDTPSSNHTESRHDTDELSASGYSSDNEYEYEAPNYEVVPEETLNHYLVDLGPSDPERGNTSLTRYHSLPNFEQADLETIPEEMAVTTQVMRIYPAQSVGEISSHVSVPHHRVHIPSSSSSNGPDSPSSKCTSSAATGPTPPTITEPQESNGRRVEEGCSVAELAPGLMTVAVHVLHDEEEEEEDLDEPVAIRKRKTSAVNIII